MIKVRSCFASLLGLVALAFAGNSSASISDVIVMQSGSACQPQSASQSYATNVWGIKNTTNNTAPFACPVPGLIDSWDGQAKVYFSNLGGGTARCYLYGYDMMGNFTGVTNRSTTKDGEMYIYTAVPGAYFVLSCTLPAWGELSHYSVF